MAVPSREYWRARAIEREAEYRAGSQATIDEVQRAYDRAFADLEKQIQSMERQLDRQGSVTDNYVYRMNKAFEMQRYAADRFKSVADIEIKATESRYKQLIQSAYLRTALDVAKGLGLGFSFSALPENVILTTLNQVWKGRNFRESVWKNTALTAQSAAGIIRGGLAGGTGIRTMTTTMVRQMADNLQDVKYSARYAAERLIRTEVNFYANQGEMLSMRAMDVDEYVFTAILDDVTCEVCGGLDGQVFKLSAATPGENYPPMHPFDRCVAQPVIRAGGKAIRSLTRLAKDPATGETYKVPGEMTYSEWIGAAQPRLL